MAVCQNLVPLVNIKIAGKWMFITKNGINRYWSIPTWLTSNVLHNKRFFSQLDIMVRMMAGELPMFTYPSSGLRRILVTGQMFRATRCPGEVVWKTCGTARENSSTFWGTGPCYQDCLGSNPGHGILQFVFHGLASFKEPMAAERQS